MYELGRNSVSAEIEQVEDLFLVDAVKKGKSAKEIELAHLLHARNEYEKLQVVYREIETARED